MSAQPPNEEWPTLQQGALIERGDTVVGAPPPPNPFIPPPPPPPDRHPSGAALFAIGALALAVAGAAAAWLYLYMHRHDQPARTVVVTTAPSTAGAVATSKVAVPRLVGLPAARAAQRLRLLHLRLTVIRKKPAGAGAVVVSQVPGAGVQVARRAPVTIVVAGGTRSVLVPDVTQQTLARADATLRRLGLKVVTTPVTTSHLPAGVVAQQVPRADQKVARSSLVTLSVAKAPGKTTTSPQGTTSTAATTTAPATTAPTTTAQAPAHPATATIPNVAGQQESGAVDALANAGILPSLAFVPNSDPLGTVEQQAKPAGTTVPYHTHMQINISEGPSSPPSEPVPNVIGKTLDQALSAVNGAHLRLIYVKLDVPRAQAGKIVQQSPLAGGQAPQNAQVLVFLGAYRG